MFQNYYKKISIFLLLLLLVSQGAGQTNLSESDIARDFDGDVDIKLTATTKSVQLLPGPKTRVFTYESELIKGQDKNLEKMKGTYLGPIIHVKPGQTIRIRFENELSRESVIHWHGLHIPPEMDGHPRYAINKGETYIYQFEVNNRPGTYWFHPHPDKITGPQVYYGLAGMFIVEGEQQELPSGEFDKPLIIQDRKFSSSNQLVYLENNRMAQMIGFLGDRIFVNGKADREKEVKKATYRFRILNGSNSRIYKLAWSDGTDLKIIGTDGGLLSKSANKQYLMLAPGERVELWKDFSQYKTGEEVRLKSLSYDDGASMPMGRMMGGRRPRGIANGTEVDICSFEISSQSGPVKELPQNLATIDRFDPGSAINTRSPRKFHFTFERMQWVINGETFEMNEVAEWEKVKLNTTEIWEFINGGGSRGMMGRMMGNMMQMPHPVHIHGLQFQIIGRDLSNVNRSAWRTVRKGFLDKGWQDTFLLFPGMKTQVIMRFKDFTGKYIYHCHNLEHEDMGMMRNYEVIGE